MYSLDTTDTFVDALEVGVAVGHVLPGTSCCYSRITGCGAMPSQAMLFPLTW